MAGKSNVKLKRDRWTAAELASIAAAWAAAVAVVIMGFRWLTSLDVGVGVQVLALLAIGAVVALKIALGFLAALCGVIRRP